MSKFIIRKEKEVKAGQLMKSIVSGTLIYADKDTTGIFFSGTVVSDPKGIHEKHEKYSDTWNCQAFEPVLEFKYPTLFEVVMKYQTKGYNLDFDKRGSMLFCFINESNLSHRSPCGNVKYRYSETENELVRGILFVLSATDPEARKQYEQIKEFELKHKS